MYITQIRITMQHAIIIDRCSIITNYENDEHLQAM